MGTVKDLGLGEHVRGPERSGSTQMKAVRAKAGTRVRRMGCVSKVLCTWPTLRDRVLLQSTVCVCSAQLPCRAKENRDISLASMFETANRPVPHSISPVRYHLALVTRRPDTMKAITFCTSRLPDVEGIPR